MVARIDKIFFLMNLSSLEAPIPSCVGFVFFQYKINLL